MDRKIGPRIRNRRLICKLTQEQLAQALGVSFQQIQKYELGKNRVSAGALFEMSQIMKTPISWFFMDMQQDIEIPAPANAYAMGDDVTDREIQCLIESYSQIAAKEYRALAAAVVQLFQQHKPVHTVAK